MSEPLLALRRASVRFGALTALRAIDLELQRGERLMLVGPNGSGKTTLLRLLQGVVAAAEGERLLPAVAPVTAMVFQKPFLLRLSVRRNLHVALWLRGVPRSEWAARTGDALRRVGLEGMAERAAPTLSGGQQQRLALARAWALRPDLLLLDEPTASLDPGAKREVEALVAQIADAGVTLVMSTHNLGQARRLGARIACLEGGRLLVDRPTTAFFDDPLPPAAAAFVKGELPWP